MNTTICVTSFNACDALALMIETFRYHHPEPVLIYVYDNGSKDGALEYAEEHADRVWHGDNSDSHGECLTRLCQAVETPYIMTVDNDIEFKAPVLDMMRDAIADEDAYCSCLTRLWPLGTFDIYGKEMTAMWSPNIAVGLMKTEKAHRLFQWATLGYYMNEQRREHGETGAMFYRLAMASGYTLVEIPELWERVVHHGSISSLWLGAGDNPVIRERYDRLQRRLSEFRNGTG